MQWYELMLTIVGSVIASSGFWSWIMMRHEKKDLKTQMLLGLGHDRIIFLCEKYIDRGWISTDEYENLATYLYEPYVKMGGNGTARRLMGQVEKLPVRKSERNNATAKVVKPEQK